MKLLLVLFSFMGSRSHPPLLQLLSNNPRSSSHLSYLINNTSYWHYWEILSSQYFLTCTMLPLLHPPPLCVLRPPFCNSSSGDGVQRGCSFCAPLKRTHGLCACVSLNEVGGRSESLTWASISGEHAACRSLSQRFQSSLSTSIICDKWDISTHTHTHTSTNPKYHLLQLPFIVASLSPQSQ